ncbi:MAG: hypothetical protein FWG69_03760 [Oscillospiraceae bacterium]|nr:hypothetical protein [Oscillospiraceae bacterium]
MRKIAVLLTLLMLTLLTLTVTLFFACTGAERGTSIESEAEEPQSEEVSSEILSSEESLKEELSSEISSEAVSFEEEDKPRLNEDLLSDIGLTYPELIKKRGRLKNVIGGEGGVGYKFENGYGGYFWAPINLDYGRKIKESEGFPKFPIDENNNIIIEKAYLPKPQIKCIFIDNIQIKDLFLEFSSFMEASEIENIYNIKYHGSMDESEFGYQDWEYSSYFTYEDKSITIYTHKKGVIDLNSWIIIKKL